MLLGWCFFLIFCSFALCSQSTSHSTAEIIPNFTDLVLQEIENENSTHFIRNFLQAAYTHKDSHAFLLDWLAVEYNDDFWTWTEQIDCLLHDLKGYYSKELEEFVNDQLIPMHPFYFYKAHVPFSIKSISKTCTLSQYFGSMEHSIFYSQLLAIRRTRCDPPAIYSDCHISLLNLLNKYSRLISSNGLDRYHLAFIFRAALYKYELVLNCLLHTVFQTRELNLSQMAQDLYGCLHAFNPEIARMALRSSVYIYGTACLSHLSYSEVIREHFEQSMTPLPPKI